MEAQCEFCKAEPATLKCNECPNMNLLCLDCYKAKHKSEATRSHKPMALGNNEEAKAFADSRSGSGSVVTKEKNEEIKSPISADQLKNDSPRIYSTYTEAGKCQNLVYFDLKNKKINSTGIKAAFTSSVLQMENRIFIIGGVAGHNVFVNNLDEFIESSNSLISRAPMINARFDMGLSKINKQAFCVIGGRTKKMLKSCEKYDLESNKWTPLPDLNTARFCSACALFNDSIIFAFGGSTAVSSLNTIESLDVNDEKSNWKNISLTLNQVHATQNNPCMFQINSSSLLIFRGIETDVYEFNVKESTLKNATVSATPDRFHDAPNKIGDIIYAIGYASNLHEYRISDGKYSSYKG